MLRPVPVEGDTITAATSHTHPDQNCSEFWKDRGQRHAGIWVKQRGLLGVSTTCGRLQFSVALTEGETVWSRGFREEQNVTSLLGQRSSNGHFPLLQPLEKAQKAPGEQKPKKLVSMEPSPLIGGRVTPLKRGYLKSNAAGPSRRTQTGRTRGGQPKGPHKIVKPQHQGEIVS